ncbi:PREDICTED: uncharacterized protein LOC105959677 [Erythranthe guttata]|uniref:uncharacterized protein LOC105959677 n=1 Tax=Erythranthe guttata TaxID=4155 RepID=UPI00064E13C3|nr:PREDICTED: uncharacterized protein LOC105959677 [Erythranthe guttata]|eukprot:XP_012839271.1 PREDICTED: uncharacterized protein LOC105959677 [Erythranthe guttata]
MATNLMLVLKFDGVYAVKKCLLEFDFDTLIGFVRAKWDTLNRSNMILTYSVGGNGEGMLGDDDDVGYMFSLIRQLSIERIEINIKLKSGIVAQQHINVPTTPSDRIIQFMQPRMCNGGLNTVTPPERHLLSMSWANLIKDVGQVFAGGASEFRKALCKFSVEVGFDFNYVKNERVRVTAVCEYRSSKNCMWRIHASIEKANGFFYIRKYEKHHTCGCGFGTSSKRRLTSNIIADLIVNDVREMPDTSPNDIIVSTKLNYGFDINYYIAWKAVSAGKEHVFGDHSSSYSHLPSYFEELVSSNPGSAYHIDVDGESMKFKRCFFAIGACLYGFKACRPLLCVDGTFLKGKHRGMLLSAVGKDGDNGLFPVAFAIVSEETDSNWAYFLTHLRDVIGTDRSYTFRQEFDIKFSEFVRNGGTRVANFLADLPINKWSCAYFEGARYGEMTSNAVESWNGKTTSIRGLPITNLVDGIRSILMMWMCTRSEDAKGWATKLCHDVDINVNDLVQQGRVWFARKSSEHVYEVMCSPNAIVDVNLRTCSCGMWQISGVLCAHAACVLFKSSNLKYDYIDKLLYTESYRKTYSYSIHPFVKRAVVDENMIGAPDHHPQRGRPRVKRIPSRGESIARKMKLY